MGRKGVSSNAKIVTSLALALCVCPACFALPKAGEPTSEAKLAVAINEFSAGEYAEATRTANDLIDSSQDTAITDEAKRLVILSIAAEYGYEQASYTAQSMHASAALLSTIPQLEEYKKDYDLIQTKPSDLVNRNSETGGAAEAELWNARHRMLVCGQKATVDAFRRVIVRHPGSKEGYIACADLASLYQSWGQSEKARSLWWNSAVAMRNSEYGERCIMRLPRFYRDTQNSTGILTLRSFARRYGSARACAAIPIALGQLLECQGGVNTDHALAQYRDCIKRYPDSISAGEAVVRIARVYTEVRGGADEAASELEKIADLHPRTEVAAKARCSLGSIYIRLNKLDMAERALLQITDHRPPWKIDAEARHLLAAVYYAKAGTYYQNNDATALGKACRYDSITTRRCRAYLRLAALLTTLHRYGEAEGYLQLILVDSSPLLDACRQSATRLQRGIELRISLGGEGG